MTRLARAIGIEGAFLSAGVASLAVAASFLSPAGPWVVVGLALTIAGALLAIPARR